MNDSSEAATIVTIVGVNLECPYVGLSRPGHHWQSTWGIGYGRLTCRMHVGRGSMMACPQLS